MCDYKFFSKDPNQWDKNYQSLWGCHSICPLLEQFQVTQVTQSELSSFTGSGAWGNTKIFCSDLAYLLVLPKKATKEEMMFGLAVVWCIPIQAQHPCFGWGGKETQPIHHILWELGLHLCDDSMRMPNVLPSLRNVNLVLWLKGHPVEMQYVSTSAN